jgi:predicted RNA-binding protein YlqC (UPF0109 family)
MVDQFLKEFAKLIASNPENVRVEQIEIDKDFSEIILYADKVDTGKLIGKDGKMINAIKTIISGCRAKTEKSYKITIKSNDEE